MASNIALFDPPTAYQAAYQQPTGSRFGADAMYHGENRAGGAHFSYLFNKKDQPKSEKANKDEGEKESNDFSYRLAGSDESFEITVDDNDDETLNQVQGDNKNVVTWDSLSLKIYDGDRLIRTLTQKAPKENGIQKWTWYMDEAGGDRPSRFIRNSNRESGGVSVKPGTYKAVLHYGDQLSETTIKVASDPRLNVSQKNTDEVYKTLKELEQLQQIVADATKQLAESKSIASKYQADLSKLDKKTYKDDIEASKAIVKSIDSLLDKFFGKEDKRQGITRNSEVTPLQRLGVARSYVSNSQTGITSTETTLIKHAKDAVSGLLEETNLFYTEKWNAYQEKMKSIKTDPFKEIKTFKID
jgi:hypothetical protein